MFGSVVISTEDGFTNTIPVFCDTQYAEKLYTDQSGRLGPFNSIEEAIWGLRFYQSEFWPRGLSNFILNFAWNCPTTDNEGTMKKVFPNANIGAFTSSSTKTTLLGTQFPVGQRQISSYYIGSYYISGASTPKYLFPDCGCGGRSNVPITVHSYTRAHFSATIPVLRNDAFSGGSLTNIFLEALGNSSGYSHVGTLYLEVSRYDGPSASEVGWFFSCWASSRPVADINPVSYMALASGYDPNYQSDGRDPFVDESGGGSGGLVPSGSPGGISTGSFDFTDDPVLGDTPVPDISVRSTGFVELFMPTGGELNSLSSWMHSNVEQLLKSSILGDPINSIISLHAVPCIPIHSATPSRIWLGLNDTGVDSLEITNQYQKVTLGPLQLTEIYGAYLDYTPHSYVSLFLPFIGTVGLDVDDIRGREMYIVYTFDVFTGAFVAEVIVDGELHYSYSGTCIYQIPVSGNYMPNIVSSIVSIATTAINVGLQTPVDETGSIGVGSAIVAGMQSGVAQDAVGAVKSVQPHTNLHGGSLGHLGGKTPYLILQTPRALVPAYQNKLIGYPNMSYHTFEELNGSGYTEFYKIRVPMRNGMSDEELAEFEEIMYNGVIF